MAQDVVVEIGAKIDKLIDGVNQVKEKIGEVKGSTEAFGMELGHIGELIAEVFAVEKIIQFIESMANLGLQIERTSTMLGASAEDIVQLRGMAALTGTSIDTLALGIERMSLNIQRSTRDGLNPAAQALRNFGINAQQYAALDTPGKIDLLHDAVSRFTPSMELTNAVMQVGGRGIAQMIPFLHQNKEQWQTFKDAVREASDGLAKAAPGMAGTHANITLMGLAIESFGARIFTVMRPAIDLAVDAVTKFVKSMTSEKIQATAKAIINWVVETLASLAELFGGLNEVLDGLSGALDKVLGKVRAMVFGLAVGGAAGGVIGGPLGGVLGAIAGGATAEKIYNFLYPPIEDGVAAVEKKTPEWVERMRAIAERIKNAISAATTPEHAESGAVMPPINFAAKEQLEAFIKTQEGQIKAAQDGFKQRQAILDQEVATFRLSEMGKARMVGEAQQQMIRFEIDAADRVLARQDLTLAQHKEWENRKTEFTRAAALVRTQTQTAEFQKAVDGMQRYGDALLGAWNSNLRGMLAGTTSFGEAIKHTFADMVIFVIEQIEKMLIKLAILEAAEIVTGVAAPAGSYSVAKLMGFQEGTPNVLQTQLAVVHQGEMIIPSGMADMVRSGQASIGGGGGNTSISIQAWDGASVDGWLRGGGARKLAQHVAQTWNNNRDTRPRY